MKVTLEVRAEVYGDAKTAGVYYKTYHDLDKSTYFDADLTGLGDEAYGTNRDWDLGVKTSDYTVRIRSGNLFFTTKVVTYGTAFIPKADIKARVLAQAKVVFAALPKK